MSDDIHGFILSEAALYSFKAQDVFPDLISFCAAIPDHLRPLFLIPIQLDTNSDVPYGNLASVASRVASYTYMDGMHEATPEGELFSYQTFVYDEDEPPLIPSSEPGSIHNKDTGPTKTHHQEDPEEDENIQVPTDTSYMSDVDMTQYWDYPYRSEEQPRHSSIMIAARSLARRVALKTEQLETKAPEEIQDRAETCLVNFISYDKRGRVFTFEVNCGNVPRTVRAAMSDIDHVALTCNCPFWQYGGPEFHAKENRYLLGPPRGTATPPDIRDPDRKFFLCKHAYAVLARLDHFVERIVEENWDLDDAELLEIIDKEWDKLEPTAQIDLDEAIEEEPEIEEIEEEPEGAEEEPEEAEAEVEEESEEPEVEEEPEEAEEAEPEEAEAEAEEPEEAEAEEPEEAEAEEPEAEEEEEKEK